MGRELFKRVDIAITIKRSEDGGAWVRIDSPHDTRKPKQIRLSKKTVTRWLDLEPNALLPGLAKRLSLTRTSPIWKAWKEKEGSLDTRQAMPLPRLTLNVTDLELARLAWESSLHPHIPKQPYHYSYIVRVSPVVPRLISIPLTLPLRFLQVKSSLPSTLQSFELGDMIRDFFGSHPGELVDQAVQVETCSFSGLDDFRESSNWPTAEVLHFDRFPTLEKPEVLLTTADPERPGTLGWLARLADTWQTRLIVIQCDNAQKTAQARRLATALLNRGGPAVLVWHLADLKDPERDYFPFYNRLIHDGPLDLCFGSAHPSKHSLFVGAGRSEGLRVSTLGEGLSQLASELESTEGVESKAVQTEIRQMLERLKENRDDEFRPPDIALDTLQTYLGEVRDDLDNLVFHFHEGEGLLPLTERLSRVRSLAGWRPPTRPLETGPLEAPKTPQARFVNAHFSSWSDGELSFLDQKDTRLITGETYLLGVQIGPQQEHVQVYGATALLEEIFRWTPDKTGVWLEVGLTGLDFEVLGEPLQEIWLPRDDASETIYFAVVPQTTKVARLRYCLYYKSDLIQSFRLAALTRRPKDSHDPPLTVRTKRLAHALDLPATAVGDVGYLPKLEYSVTANLGDAPKRPKRAVSIVANDLDGRPVITVKGPDLFEIRTNDDLPDHVDVIRHTLEHITESPIGGEDSHRWMYNYGTLEQPNVGDEDKLKEALTKLATEGWILYDAIVHEKGRKQLATTLQDEGQTIHVAHILLEKVIPWAIVYDRRYDPCRKLDDNGNPVAHDVCLAALPDENGQFPNIECEKDPNCLLHPDRCQERLARGEPSLLPDTVVCPKHFWGFKHIIELPPQQTTTPQENGQQQGGSRQGREQQTCILTSPPTQMTAGLHAHLPLFDKHLQELEDLIREPSINAEWRSRASHRDLILKNLKDTDLDLIYFYCHASDKDASKGKVHPYLEFQDEDEDSPGMLNAAALDHNQLWAHHPLVFLNGCRTAGFSPRAISPFITKLVEGRGAAGVIGTEISVWEELAGEMALRFFREFLSGSTAGEALLSARRALLAKYNPLGLIYTLYAAANLRLDLDGDGRCTSD
jgi:hypothetical protein